MMGLRTKTFDRISSFPATSTSGRYFASDRLTLPAASWPSAWMATVRSGALSVGRTPSPLTSQVPLFYGIYRSPSTRTVKRALSGFFMASSSFGTFMTRIM